MVLLSKKTERGILLLQKVSNPDELKVRMDKDHYSSLPEWLAYNNQAPVLRDNNNVHSLFFYGNLNYGHQNSLAIEWWEYLNGIFNLWENL